MIENITAVDINAKTSRQEKKTKTIHWYYDKHLAEKNTYLNFF